MQDSDECSTSGLNQVPMEEFIPEIKNEANTSTYEMFSTDNDPEVVFDDEKSEFCMPNYFEDETKFCEPIS